MPLTATYVPGMTMVAGDKWTVDDWNAALRGTFTITGGVGGADIANDAILAAHLNQEVVNGQTAATALAVGDKFLMYDLSATDNRAITVANALNGIFGLAPAATFFSAYATDLVTLGIGGVASSMTVARFAEELVAEAPVLASTDDADEVLVHDASATDGSQATRVTLANVLPNKGTAGTYTGVSGLTTDAKGRVTAVVANTRWQSSLTAMPTVTGTATEVPHTLGVVPGIYHVQLVCQTADAGYTAGEAIDISRVKFDTGSSAYNAEYAVRASASKFYVTKPDFANAYVLEVDSTPVFAAFTAANWKFRITAIL